LKLKQILTLSLKFNTSWVSNRLVSFQNFKPFHIYLRKVSLMVSNCCCTQSFKNSSLYYRKKYRYETECSNYFKSLLSLKNISSVICVLLKLITCCKYMNKKYEKNIHTEGVLLYQKIRAYGANHTPFCFAFYLFLRRCGFCRFSSFCFGGKCRWILFFNQFFHSIQCQFCCFFTCHFAPFYF
jgi:hypothetical protein